MIMIMVTNYFVARQTGGARPKSVVELHPLLLAGTASHGSLFSNALLNVPIEVILKSD